MNFSNLKSSQEKPDSAFCMEELSKYLSVFVPNARKGIINMSGGAGSTTCFATAKRLIDNVINVQMMESQNPRSYEARQAIADENQAATLSGVLSSFGIKPDEFQSWQKIAENNEIWRKTPKNTTGMIKEELLYAPAGWTPPEQNHRRAPRAPSP